MNANSQFHDLAKRSKILVYFLAAPEEEDECQAIKKHLTPAIRSSRIPVEINSDFEIPAGEDKAKYKQKLFEADIVLALISADYISDDETYERTQKVIQRYNNGETILVPILVRNCLWKHTPFVKLPLLPKNLQPLNNKQFWNSEDDALMAIVEDIYEAINEFGSADEEVAETPVEIKNGTTQNAEQATAKADREVITTPTDVPVGQKHAVIIEEAEVTEKLSAPEIITTQPVETQAGESPKQKKTPPKAKKTVVPIEVDWRKQHYKQATWKRFWAYMIDQIITVPPAIFVGFVLAALIFPEYQGTDPTDAEMFRDLSITIGFYLIVCAIMESSKWRGTFGKMIMKIQITEKDGQKISFFRALWRNVARVIVGYSYIFIIPLIVQIFTFKKSKKLFHDQLSSTVIGERLS